jgi:hypothetical protein
MLASIITGFLLIITFGGFITYFSTRTDRRTVTPVSY